MSLFKAVRKSEKSPLSPSGVGTKAGESISSSFFSSGLCASLPLSVEWLSFFALFAFIPYLLILFSHLLGEQKRSLAFWYRQGFLFFFGYLIGVFHWFVAMYPMEFAGDFSPTVAVFVVAFSWFGLSFLQTLVYALSVLLTGALARLQVVRRYPLSLPFLFAAAFTVAEFLQTLTWAGTPWGVYAVTQANRALTLAPASLFGAHFVSFLLILSFYTALFMQRRRRP